MPELNAIRQRWANTRWPRLGYFVHGQAKDDIFDLLMIAETYGEALRTIASQSDAAMTDARLSDPLWPKRVASNVLARQPFPAL